MANSSPRYSFIPQQILQALFCIIAFLVLISLIGHYLPSLGFPNYTSTLLSVNSETSISTWYSSLLLLLCAVLLAIIASTKSCTGQSYYRHWQALSLIFVYLSIDESILIHEKLVTPLQEALNTSGFFKYAWVIVAIPLVSLFALIYLRFLAHLPPQIRYQFCLAGLCYISGALGVEMVSAYVSDLYSSDSLAYLICFHIEEALEMAGASLFLYALLGYLGLYSSEVKLHFRPAQRLFGLRSRQRQG